MNMDSSPGQSLNHHDQVDKLDKKIIAAQMSFVGPIPPPSVLAKYEELQSGLAERIVKMAELQSEHRRELEAKSLEAQIKHLERNDAEVKRGQIFAFVIAITTILTGAYVVATGHEISGTIVSGLGLSGIITAFLYGKNNQESPKDEHVKN